MSRTPKKSPFAARTAAAASRQKPDNTSPRAKTAERTPKTDEPFAAVGFRRSNTSGTTHKKSVSTTPVARATRLAVRGASQKTQKIVQRLRDERVKHDELPAVRLQKALVLAGLGSRRAMEDVIAAGRVTVNGKVATLGCQVGVKDRIMLDGKAVFVHWPDRLPRIVVYHKQEGELVTRDDPKGRVTVFDRLPQTQSSRWVAVGRLDVNTSGLLVLTTSGELANRMMHPRFEVEREYAVRVLGELLPTALKQLVEGVMLDDGMARFERITDQGGEGANHWYRVVIKEGRNREVRRLFEAVGGTVSRLIRVRFGVLHLPPRLKRGQFHELDSAEVSTVMKWAGLALTGMPATSRRGRTR